MARRTGVSFNQFPGVLALIRILNEADYLGRLWREIFSRGGVIVCRLLDLCILVGFEGAEIGLTQGLSLFRAHLPRRETEPVLRQPRYEFFGCHLVHPPIFSGLSISVGTAHIVRLPLAMNLKPSAIPMR